MVRTEEYVISFSFVPRSCDLTIKAWFCYWAQCAVSKHLKKELRWAVTTASVSMRALYTQTESSTRHVSINRVAPLYYKHRNRRLTRSYDAPWEHPNARRHMREDYHVCASVSVCARVSGRVYTSMCVIALTFHCHEFVLIVVTAANCTVC